MIADTTPLLDVSSLTSTLTTATFADVIASVLPIVAVAVLVGFLFYVIRWGIGLFRGIQRFAGVPLFGNSRTRRSMEELAQAFVDVLAWFLAPFSLVMAVSWVVGLFRYR